MAGLPQEPDRGVIPTRRRVMLRVHCVQLLYNFSRPRHGGSPFSRGQALLYESDPVRRFVGLRLTAPLPDETTILHFRHSFGKAQPGAGPA